MFGANSRFPLVANSLWPENCASFLKMSPLRAVIFMQRYFLSKGKSNAHISLHDRILVLLFSTKVETDMEPVPTSAGESPILSLPHPTEVLWKDCLGLWQFPQIKPKQVNPWLYQGRQGLQILSDLNCYGAVPMRTAGSVT